MNAQYRGLRGPAIGEQTFDGIDDLSVEQAAALLKEAPIGHFMGKGVLEGVLRLGKETCLVQKLRGLQSSEPQPQAVLRLLDDGVEEDERHVLADDSGGLEK